MALKQKIEVRYLTSMKNGMAEFFTPQSSNETILVQVAAGAMDPTFRTFQSTFEQFYNPYSVRVSTIFVF